MTIDQKQLNNTAIDVAGKIDSSTKFPAKLGLAAYNTATSSGEEQQDAALGGAKSILKKAAGGAGDTVGAALGLANVLSKPAGSEERTAAAQKELISAAGILPIAGPLAANALVDKINKDLRPGEAQVKEGPDDEFNVKGSLNVRQDGEGNIKDGDKTIESKPDPAAGNVDDIQVNGELGGDGKRLLPDGSIDQGNGQVVTPEGELKGEQTVVGEGEDFTVKGELNGDNATDDGGTTVTGNGQLVSPEGDVVNVGDGPVAGSVDQVAESSGGGDAGQESAPAQDAGGGE